MIRPIPPASPRHNRLPDAVTCNHQHSMRLACILAFLAVSAVELGLAQAITIDSKTGSVTNGSGKVTSSVDRRYQQITPTNVPLTKSILDAKTRLELIRVMEAEQGFAMRPFPKGHRGLTLEANGKLDPAGEPYLNMATTNGICARPGDRLVITDVKIDHNKIVFDIDGGPDPKHRFLRHVSLGTGEVMNPVVQGDEQDPLGARLTLTFKGDVPELTGAEVKALLSPLISFDVKTPIQAFTDTLPTKLKEAILNHHVLVGMSTDMLLYAMGAPDGKSREMDGQMPFEEWIYGKPPKDVQFVRVNGNRVIRVEIAKMGQTPVIFTKDEVDGLMRTDGTPLEAKNEHVTKEGDAQRDPNREEAAPAPSLRKPGETLPADDPTQRTGGEMRPVRFPAPKPTTQPGDNPDGEPAATPATAGPATPDASQPTPPNGATKPQQPPSAPAGTTPATPNSSNWVEKQAVM